MRAPDFSLALRNIFRRPGFAAVAIALLALGAGANAAVFSVVRGVLLRPLPYPQPERLTAFWPETFVSNDELAFWQVYACSDFPRAGGTARALAVEPMTAPPDALNSGTGLRLLAPDERWGVGWRLRYRPA